MQADADLTHPGRECAGHQKRGGCLARTRRVRRDTSDERGSTQESNADSFSISPLSIGTLEGIPAQKRRCSSPRVTQPGRSRSSGLGQTHPPCNLLKRGGTMYASDQPWSCSDRCIESDVVPQFGSLATLNTPVYDSLAVAIGW